MVKMKALKIGIRSKRNLSNEKSKFKRIEKDNWFRNLKSWKLTLFNAKAQYSLKATTKTTSPTKVVRPLTAKPPAGCITPALPRKVLGAANSSLRPNTSSSNLPTTRKVTTDVQFSNIPEVNDYQLMHQKLFPHPNYSLAI